MPWYQCPYCYKGFVSNMELAIHMATCPERPDQEPEPEPEPEPTPTDEELIYANWLRTGGTGSIAYWRSIGSPLYYTPPPTYYTCPHCGAQFTSQYSLNVHIETAHPPEPTDEELIYANWLRTGGTGSFAYWQSIGSPLYYTPEPEPEPVEGAIIRKELEYSGSGDGTVPVVGVPLGVSAKLHVWGRNNSSTSQPIGIYWFVNDPDGLIVEEYTDWKFGTLGPGQTHEFISSGQFNLDKVGRYGTWIELLMGSPEEIVDRYTGHLCTVEAAVPEYKGSIVTKELEYNDTRISI